MVKPLFILAGLYNKQRLDLCYRSLQRLYGNSVDFACACHMLPDTPSQQGTQDWCDQHGLEYFDIRQPWYDSASESPYSSFPYLCEAVAIWSIFKHFFDKGYEEVYYIHNDTVFLRDFLSEYRMQRKGNWSMIFPLTQCYYNGGKIVRTREEYLSYERPKKQFLALLNHINVDHWSNWRLSVFCITCNPDFLRSVYQRYGSEEEIYQALFKGSNECADLSYYEVMDWEGYSIQVIPGDVVAQYDMPWSYGNRDFMDFVVHTPELKYLHGPLSVRFICEFYGEDSFFQSLETGIVNDNQISKIEELLPFIRRKGYKRGLLIGDALCSYASLFCGWEEGELWWIHTWEQCPNNPHPNNILTDQQRELLRQRIATTNIPITFHVGNYRKIIPCLDQVFDFVIYSHIDMTYETIYECMKIVFPKIREGGLLFGMGQIVDIYSEGEKNKPVSLRILYDNPAKTWNYIGEYGANSAIRDFTREHGLRSFITCDGSYFNHWYFFKETDHGNEFEGGDDGSRERRSMS